MKKKWPKPSKEFPVPLYGGRCYLYRSDSQYRLAREWLGTPLPTGVRAGAASHIQCRKTGESIYLIGWFDKDLATLVHELGHVALYVMDNVGIDPKDGSGEPYCYLLDALFSLCYGGR